MARIIASISTFTDVYGVIALTNPEFMESIRRQVEVKRCACDDVPRELTEAEKHEIQSFGFD